MLYLYATTQIINWWSTSTHCTDHNTVAITLSIIQRSKHWGSTTTPITTPMFYHYTDHNTDDLPLHRSQLTPMLDHYTDHNTDARPLHRSQQRWSATTPITTPMIYHYTDHNTDVLPLHLSQHWCSTTTPTLYTTYYATAVGKEIIGSKYYALNNLNWNFT